MSMKSARKVIAVATTSLVFVTKPQLSEAKSEQPSVATGNEKQTHDVALYLTPQSKETLKKYIGKLEPSRIDDIDPTRIVIRRTCTTKDSYEYEPLYGERAAFRLKGMVRTESGLLAGMGRVSTMTGELKDDHCMVSLPLIPSDSIGSIDLPTRLQDANVVRGKSFWKGRIIAGRVLDRSYPAEKASFTEIIVPKQLVVDGYLCSSEFVDDKGHCLFDRTQIETSSSTDNHHSHNIKSTEEINKTTTNSSSSSSSSSSSDHPNSTNNDETTHECPVCKYMKAGPCRAQFEQWDTCVQGLTDTDDLSKCFDVTMNMMQCMRGHEYYDMMTAGTEEKYEAAQNVSTNKTPL